MGAQQPRRGGATYFAAAMLALRQAVLHADPAIATAIQPVVTLLVAQIAIYSQAANSHRNLDRLLYDIPDEEYQYRRTQTPRKHLRIASSLTTALPRR